MVKVLYPELSSLMMALAVSFASPRTPFRNHAPDKTCCRVTSVACGSLRAETVLANKDNTPFPAECSCPLHFLPGRYSLSTTRPTGKGFTPATPPSAVTGILPLTPAGELILRGLA